MILPPLYKYLDIKGTKLTLENRTFRHAKPSDFNDDMDMTVQSLFPESEEMALKIIMENYIDILQKNLNKPITHLNSEIRCKLNLIQQTFRENSDTAQLVKSHTQNDRVSDIYDLEHIKKFSHSSINKLNELLQNYRIFCVSEKNNSTRMWENYAQKHKGIVLRILPNVAKDSKFTLFRKVKYQTEKPPLFESTLSFLEDSLFADQKDIREKVLDRIVYTKTSEWAYEHEHRLAIPIFNGENWDTIPYHPEEISELYLGAKMEDIEKNIIINLAKAINSNIIIFQTSIDTKNQFNFTKL